MTGIRVRWVFIICFLITSCTPSETPTPAALPVIDWTPQPQIPTETATSIPVSPSTLQAVTKEEISCYFMNDRGYNAVVYIPPFEVVMAVGQDLTGRWGLVSLTGFTDCWVRLNLLDLKGDVRSLPVISAQLPPMLTSAIAAISEVQPTIAPIILVWKVISHYCNADRHVESVTVDLDISGGVGPFTTSPPVPLTASPGQTLSIKVNSNTHNGEPSSMISFVVPREDSFTCANSGDNADSPPDPVDPDPVDPDPVDPDPVDPDPVDPDPVDPEPEEPDVCYNPQGHEIPCKKK
jgi:hypothetical protein